MRPPLKDLPPSSFSNWVRRAERENNPSILREGVEISLAGICARSLSANSLWVIDGLNRMREDWNGKPRWAWVYPSWSAFLDVIQLDEKLEGWFVEIAKARRGATTGEVLEEAKLRAHGGDRRSKEAKDQADNISLKHGTGRDYTLARLDRDRPDLAEKVRAKELSANAAAIEAGFRKKFTPLEQLEKWWVKANDEERKAFLEAVLTSDETDVS